MVTPEYTNYFVASTGASAALLGLLFVSISIAPERVFGSAATSTHQALALSAFTALANAFFVSLSGLIPHLQFGSAVVVMGSIALIQTLTLLRGARHWRREGRLIRGMVLFVAGLTIYGGEILVGVQLNFASTSGPLLTILLELLLAVFGISLARAWELLGAPYGRGLITGSIEWVEDRMEGKTAPAKGEPKR
jgi:hypothetical protein